MARPTRFVAGVLAVIALGACATDAVPPAASPPAVPTTTPWLDPAGVVAGGRPDAPTGTTGPGPLPATGPATPSPTAADPAPVGPPSARRRALTAVHLDLTVDDRPVRPIHVTPTTDGATAVCGATTGPTPTLHVEGVDRRRPDPVFGLQFEATALLPDRPQPADGVLLADRPPQLRLAGTITTDASLTAGTLDLRSETGTIVRGRWTCTFD